jgi:hypothetical protein
MQSFRGHSETVVGSCKEDNEPSGSMRDEKFLDEIKDN